MQLHPVRRMLLIQDIREFINEVYPRLVEIYNKNEHRGMFNETKPSTLMLWLLAELLEQVYCMTVVNYPRYQQDGATIRSLMDQSFSNFRVSLETLFSYYIKCPPSVETNNEVHIDFGAGGAELWLTNYWGPDYKNPNAINLH